MTKQWSGGLTLALVGLCAGRASAQLIETAPDPTAAPTATPARPPATTPDPVAAPTAMPAGPPETAPDPAAAPTATPAQPVFGARGQFVLSGALSASFGHLGYDNSDAATTFVELEPAFDHFIGRNFSLGAAAFVRYVDATSGIGSNTQTFASGAYGRIGTNSPISNLFSLRTLTSLGVWIQRVSFEAHGDGYMTSVGGQAVAVGSDVTETVVVAEFFAPLLLHPAAHFFVGLGPDLYLDLSHTVESSTNRRFFFGVASTVGGWF